MNVGTYQDKIDEKLLGMLTFSEGMHIIFCYKTMVLCLLSEMMYMKLVWNQKHIKNIDLLTMKVWNMYVMNWKKRLAISQAMCLYIILDVRHKELPMV